MLDELRKDYAGAEREFREAIRCDPNNVAAHIILGRLLQNVRKDYAGAEREFREAIRCDPNNVAVHINLGNLLEKVRKDYAGAEREFHKAIQCDPNYALAHRNLGCMMMQASGNCDGAEREFREALRIDPDDATARGYLERVLELKAAANVQAKPAIAQAKPTRAPSAGELVVGASVVLAGLSSAKFNGARGTIVSSCQDGRWGVKLPGHDGKAMAIKTENIRIRGGNKVGDGAGRGL
jgi:Tfp pilus assembly protein PilF